jgi:SAM-dependent methyltransferase
MGRPHDSYLPGGGPSELERLRLQSIVWEPAGRALLSKLPEAPGLKAVDIGCGALGWLRILSEWVGGGGSVLGTDVDERLLEAAFAFAESERLGNVTVVHDDIFSTRLPAESFDLVHSRFQLTPLGRMEEQMAAYRALARPGGWIVAEDPDISSWRVNPDAPAHARLVELIGEAFSSGGGNFSAGRELPRLFRGIGIEPELDAHVVALPPGHPYLRLPLQFASSLRPKLASLVGGEQLDRLIEDAAAELSGPGAWGTTFTLVQAYGIVGGR